MKNNVQLITYIDRITGADITTLTDVINTDLHGLFSGIHLLPFYYPIDGSDAGFDPINHTQVDSRLGTWNDIKLLGDNLDLMADLIVNHMSAKSEEFQDVLLNGKNSKYWDLFLTKEKVFPHGLNEEMAKVIYRPRPGSCFTTYTLADGSKVDFWTTFTDEQIDIDVSSELGRNYLQSILIEFSKNNIKTIRLDAAGYAIKKAGTSCFMLDETFDFINQITDAAHKLGLSTLVEIHSHYQTQIEIANRVDKVYDFALPPLILQAIFSDNTEALAHWLSISPRNCMTVLDTHDGIGIIDVGAVADKKGLLNDAQINALVDKIHFNSNSESKKATGEAASNVDLYQVNCTYYDALAQNDYDYLLARAIQFFAPGIPQVYYGGLFTKANDMALLAQTNVGRDINRPYLDRNEITEALSKPISQALNDLIHLRNGNNAFNGDFKVTSSTQTLEMCWNNNNDKAQLSINFSLKTAEITSNTKDNKVRINLHDYFSL